MSSAASFEATLAKTDFSLSRTSPFSYRCNACSRCCHDQTIRVSAYEILRLARYLGITTTEFIARYTEAGGTTLRTRREDGGACIFLAPQGCGVHADRPAACRVYPLARSVDRDLVEHFGHLAPHPQTEGIYGSDGTVGDFLEQQGTAPYFAASSRYAALYHRMVAALAALDPDEHARRGERRDGLDDEAPGMAASSLIDIDRTVAEFCEARGRPVPTGIDEMVATHIEAIETWLAMM